MSLSCNDLRVRMRVQTLSITPLVTHPLFLPCVLQADLHKFSPRSVKMVDKGDGFAFIRKGEVGDHKALFTSDQSRRYNEMLASAFPRE